jgi:pimeloyl-ACP methyl ester carboxylesterase
MADFYRSPDAAFDDLVDFSYAPNYLEWDGLRTHYVDEGPKDAPVALLLHGEPTWSYLHRKMIPPLLAAGYRCVAPDQGSVKAKAGARRFPWCIPFAEPEAGAAERQAQAFDALKNWSKPVNVIFGADDPIFTPAWGEKWAGMIPGATFDTVDRAGHFCQEDAGEDIVARLFKRITGSN